MKEWIHTHVEDLSSRSSSVSSIFPSHVSRVGSLRLADSWHEEEQCGFTPCHTLFFLRSDGRTRRGRCWQWWFFVLNLHPRFAAFKRAGCKLHASCERPRASYENVNICTWEQLPVKGRYSLFQVIAPNIRWGRLACYASDTLSCHRQILFSPLLCRFFGTGRFCNCTNNLCLNGTDCVTVASIIRNVHFQTSEKHHTIVLFIHCLNRKSKV